MAQSSKNIWTRRFQILLGLVLALSIVFIVIVYSSSGHSYTVTELALTGLLLLCGVGILSVLRSPQPRHIVLGAGFFVLIALLILIASPGSQGGIGRQPTLSFRQILSSWVLVIALLAFAGKVAARIVAWIEKTLSQPTSWFLPLSHVALAGIAGMELVFQILFGNQLLLVPFSSRLYADLSLNSIAVLLLIVILLSSLLRFNSPSTPFDGWIVLMLSVVCFLFQYTFGLGELASTYPGMSPSQAVGLNLALSIVPLALALFALFSEWGRFAATLWLAIQLLLLQPFLGGPFVPTSAGGAFQPLLPGQVILFVLVMALLLLAARLLLFWDYRQLNVIDGIAVVVVTLVLSLTLWSVGQSYHQQAQPFLTTPQGTNLLSLADGLIVIASLMGIAMVFALGLTIANRLVGGHRLWLGRLESLMVSLMVLSLTIGTLLLLNAIGKQSSYLATATLNPQALGVNLPAISNQYILDGLFALLLLIYASALARQRWDRSFAHTERLLVLLSGGACLLILASTGRGRVLSRVASIVQQIGGHSSPAFTAERLVSTSVLIAALISLFWLTRSRNRTDRLVLTALLGGATLCALVHFILTSPPLLLLTLFLLLLGTLIAAWVEYMRQESEAHTGTAINIHAVADTDTTILNGEA